MFVHCASDISYIHTLETPRAACMNGHMYAGEHVRKHPVGKNTISLGPVCLWPNIQTAIDVSVLGDTGIVDGASHWYIHTLRDNACFLVSVLLSPLLVTKSLALSVLWCR